MAVTTLSPNIIRGIKSTYGGNGVRLNILAKKRTEGYQRKDIGIDRRIILKSIFRKYGVSMRIRFI
jgi:hypothetical protein